MSRALFWTHLKAARWGLLAWSGLLALNGVVVVALYPTIKVSGVETWYETMLESFKDLIGAQGIVFAPGFLTLETYVVIEFMAWWAPLVAIYAIFAAGGIVAREVERGTIDLVLAQPVSRRTLVLSKFAVFAVGLLVIGLASFLGLYLGQFLIADRLTPTGVGLVLGLALALVLAVGGYSLFFSCLFLNPRKTLLVSGGLTALFYILNAAAPVLGRLAWAKKLSLFYYLRPVEVSQARQMDWGALALFLGVALAALAAALVVFERRDITP